MTARQRSIRGRVLVVGYGFIGQHFVAELVRRGEPTVVLTRSEPAAPLAGAELIVADAADPQAVARALTNVRAVVYAAGGLMPAQSEADPASDATLTLQPLLTMLEALREKDASLTFISSGGTVYGEPEMIPVAESHPTNPISAYGVVKLAAEKFIFSHAARDRLRVRVLRCANVYGEGQPAERGQGAVAAFVARLLAGRPVTLYGTGGIVRDYVYVGDVVSAALALEPHPQSRILVNVGSGCGHSLVELIAVIEQASGRRLAVERLPSRDFDVSEIVLDISRLRKLVPYEPTSLEEGVRRVLAAARGGVRTREAAAR